MIYQQIPLHLKKVPPNEDNEIEGNYDPLNTHRQE